MNLDTREEEKRTIVEAIKQMDKLKIFSIKKTHNREKTQKQDEHGYCYHT